MDETDNGNRKVRGANWTKAKREGFLEHLAATANVRASVRAVGMSEAGAYKLRRRMPEFHAAWKAALAEGYERVELLLLERALGGTPTPIVHGGEAKGEVRLPDNRMALMLLRLHRDTVKGGQIEGVTAAIGDPDLASAHLEEKLAEMHARIEAVE